jgi:hypothetical protein
VVLRPCPSQELKGNIRVFCRVRPPCEGEAADAAPGRPVLAYPAAGDLAGRGLELSQPPAGGKGGDRDVQAHSFGFDRVFAPSASQVGASRQLRWTPDLSSPCAVRHAAPACRLLALLWVVRASMLAWPALPCLWALPPSTFPPCRCATGHQAGRGV